MQKKFQKLIWIFVLVEDICYLTQYCGNTDCCVQFKKSEKKVIMTKQILIIYLILLSIIGLTSCTSSSKQITTEQNIVVVKKYHEIWSTGNVDELDDIISPEFQSHFIGGFEYSGIDGAKNAVLETKKAFPDWTENIIEIITQGDKVVTRYRSTGTHLDNWDGIEGTGNKVDIEEMSIYHLKNGKIIKQWGFWDEIELKKQLTLNTLKNL